MGLDSAVDKYAQQLRSKALSVDGGVAMLLYGIGGVGKTALAVQLFHKLAATGDFTGRIYACKVGTGLFASDSVAEAAALVKEAQFELLCQVLDAQPQRNYSLQECQELLSDRLHSRTGPVLLMVDNIPAVGSGIKGMLPDNLLDILPKA